MKLASGIARIPDMLKLGVPVGLGVDGSASNDGSSLMEELRTAFLLHRLNSSREAPSGYDFLKIATRGSALLGRDDIGSLSVGRCCDLFLIDSRRLELVGACYDPKAVLATVGVRGPVDYTVVNGRITVREGRLARIDEEATAREARMVCEKVSRAIKRTKRKTVYPPCLAGMLGREGFSMLISLIRAVILYLALILVVRLMGKRQLGEMEPMEFVVTMLIANLAAVPMQETGTPLLAGAAADFGRSERGAGLVRADIPERGRAAVFVRQAGHSDRKRAAAAAESQKTRVNTDELSEYLRIQGVTDLAQVQYAILGDERRDLDVSVSEI